ncbi:hypothetical protein NHG29_01405 [Aerococcaceae bacterium NML160702]|nr:hypothetical protein [Aerococcaceae bacterium NML190073]MCW6681522.1 hypothetical protein [Aerococcaceae bacterium NML160702]
MRSAEDLYDYLFELQEEEPKLNYLLFANNTLTIVDDEIHIEIKYLSDSEVEQLIEYINDLYHTDLEWIPVIKREIIRKDAFFLTQKAATEHLRRNAHNYTEDARTYCMHAYRCPEYERLLEILSTVDWSEVQNG